jgi:hypothetical protein
LFRLSQRRNKFASPTSSSGTKIIRQQQCDFSIYRREDVLFQLKIRGASEKFKKPAAALVKAYICQFLAKLSKSISCDSPFKGLSEYGCRAKFAEILCAFPFHEDLPNETNYRLIHLAGQYL